jgi:hypothetical protein
MVYGGKSDPQSTQSPHAAREQDNALYMTYVIVRCNRWGRYMRWLKSGRSAGLSPRTLESWWGKLMRDRVQASVSAGDSHGTCPVDSDEAAETTRCVMALPQHLRDTVIEDYVHLGSQEQKAEALGIQPRMFRYRRNEAHVVLLELFNLAAAGLPLEVGVPKRSRPPVLMKNV